MTNPIVEHLEREIRRFTPPDSDFQRGYTEALKDILAAVLAPPLMTQAMDQAVQALTGTSAPIARADELIAAVAGDALRATVHMRVEQIVKHGHTVEGDAMLPIGMLPREAKDRVISAIEAIGVTGRDRDLGLAMRRLDRAAALCWAARDRIQVALDEIPAAPQAQGGAA
jgi:hypothetical protein